jgi:hypothetical protein
MVIEPFVRMGPLPRSLAAEANDCFMVQPQHGANRIQGCNAKFRVPMAGSPRFVQTAPTGGAVNLMPLFQQAAETSWAKHNGGEPNLIQCCAVLAIVNTAARRLRRWPLASVDTRSARRNQRMQAGAKKRLCNRTKKFEKDKIEMKPTKTLDSKSPIQVQANTSGEWHLD